MERELRELQQSGLSADQALSIRSLVQRAVWEAEMRSLRWSVEVCLAAAALVLIVAWAKH